MNADGVEVRPALSYRKPLLHAGLASAWLTVLPASTCFEPTINLVEQVEAFHRLFDAGVIGQIVKRLQYFLLHANPS